MASTVVVAFADWDRVLMVSKGWVARVVMRPVGMGLGVSFFELAGLAGLERMRCGDDAIDGGGNREEVYIRLYLRGCRQKKGGDLPAAEPLTKLTAVL